LHIPDGFLSPQTYISATVVAAGLLAYSSKKVHFDTQRIPILAGLSGFAFVLMLITIPVLGATSIHLTGIAIMSILFGPWMSAIAFALVLLVQAFLLGDGGVTSLGVNIISMAFVGSFCAHFVHRSLKQYSEKIALLSAGFLSVVASAFLIAITLGLQPLIASQDGSPLYFPFALDITLVAVMVPNMIAGVLEAFLTMSAVGFLHKHFRGYLYDA